MEWNIPEVCSPVVVQGLLWFPRMNIFLCTPLNPHNELMNLMKGEEIAWMQTLLDETIVATAVEKKTESEGASLQITTEEHE